MLILRLIFVGCKACLGRLACSEGRRRTWRHVSGCVVEAREDRRSGFDGRVDGVYVVHFVSCIVILVDLFWAAASSPWEAVGRGVIVPALQGDTARIESFVFESYDFLFSFFADNDTGVSPGEVVLVPERVNWEDEGVNGEGENVDDHPAYVLPLPFDDENQGLQAIDSSQHDD